MFHFPESDYFNDADKNRDTVTQPLLTKSFSVCLRASLTISHAFRDYELQCGVSRNGRDRASAVAPEAVSC